MGELDVLLFFDRTPDVLPLYSALAECIRAIEPAVTIEVKKTQINFKNRTMFACASRLAVGQKAERIEPWLTVTFGLDHPVASPRIAVVTEAAPGRWTHHLLVRHLDEIDAELMGWLSAAAAFSATKRKPSRT